MRRPTPALVVSVIALVLALTGSAIAGGYIITSTKQIKPSVKRALKGNRGPRGFDGAAGAQGPAGPVNVSQMTRVEQNATFPPGAISHATATCPAGMGAVHGDWSIVSDSGVPFYELTGPTDYSVGVDNFNSTQSADVSVIVFCVPSGSAVAARAHGPAASTLDARQRARH